MNIDDNQRICSFCNKVVVHKNSVDARSALEKNKPCRECSYKQRRTTKIAQCPKCDFESKKMTHFEKHLNDVHNTTTQQLWNDINNGPKLCACGCGNITSWTGWWEGYKNTINFHTHKNLTVVLGEERLKLMSEKRKIRLTGRVGWSKGLTKETDERIKKNSISISEGRQKAFDEGRLSIWSKGLTKETDERIKKNAEKFAQRFVSGDLVPWAKGLSKETDERIAKMAIKVALSHKNTNLRNHLDDLKKLKANEIKERIEKHGTLTVLDDNLDSYINDNTPNISVVCIRCGSKFSSTLRRLQYGKCLTCDSTGSVAQNQISDWLKTLVNNVDTNKRGIIGGLELDIYVPSLNVAIEYNGLYWHSVLHKSAIYHDNKSSLCRDQNITLIHVFEDEWREKCDIIKSMVIHKLKLTPNKINARSCTIKLVSKDERQKFFNENHVDGDTNAKYAYALIYNEKIVAVVSLRTPFHKKHAQKSIEVARACCKLNTNVNGWLSKLTNHVQKQVKTFGFEKILTYVDTRHGSGNSWSSCGWSKISETPPRFWWTDCHDRFNRFKFKADKSRNMTEAQVAEEADVIKIWGCKNLVFETS
jgi:hypothetical protein